MDYKEKEWNREKNRKNRDKKVGIGRRGETRILKKRGDWKENKSAVKKISGIGRTKWSREKMGGTE